MLNIARYILDEYCAARRTALVGSFIDALTLGEGFGGTPNPIEMHANDPKRYVGDMLAWLHQVIPVEKENILMLVKSCDKTGKKLSFFHLEFLFKYEFVYRRCVRSSETGVK